MYYIFISDNWSLYEKEKNQVIKNIIILIYIYTLLLKYKYAFTWWIEKKFFESKLFSSIWRDIEVVIMKSKLAIYIRS